MKTVNWTIEPPVTFTEVTRGNINVTASGTFDYDIAKETEGSDASALGYVNGSIRNFLDNLKINNIVAFGAIEYDKQVLEKIQENFNASINNIIAEANKLASVDGIKVNTLSLTNVNIKEAVVQSAPAGATVVNTANGKDDGQEKCPNCGATDIKLMPSTGKLRCEFCHTEFEPKKVEGFKEDLSNLQGTIVGSGASNIIPDAGTIMTLKCQSCGAEVVIDTASSASAKCHWCRNVLSINNQIPNGAIPDVVLPFSVKKEEAKAEIEKFVKKRKFFANSKFKQEFTTDNIMGVYFPYMIVDANMHSKYHGTGEILKRTYTVGNDNNRTTYYDADAYTVDREFDLTVSGLSIESSKDKLNNAAKDKTNNVINAIMPFDTENAVKWDANYLRGYTSEKRDTNVDDLKGLVETQTKDVSRFAANDTLKQYNRGVCWEQEEVNIKGSQWKASYLPVWLYSYQQVKGDKKVLHYVAVNARTKETMGSVPLNMGLLILMSILVEIACFISMLYLDFDYNWLLLAGGVVFFFIMFTRYRNQNARHTYEKETKRDMSNLVQNDAFLETRKRLTNSRIRGWNNESVNGATIKKGLTGASIGNAALNTLTGSQAATDVLKNAVNKNNTQK